MNTPSLAAILEISERFKAGKINFALGGSGLLYALGLIDEVNDWDLTTNEDFLKVSESLIGLEYTKVEHSNIFKSDFLLKLTLQNSNIDIIGNFKLALPNGDLHKVSCRISGYWNNIPLADPNEWLNAYQIMGMENKASKLKTYFGQKK